MKAVSRFFLLICGICCQLSQLQAQINVVNGNPCTNPAESCVPEAMARLRLTTPQPDPKDPAHPEINPRYKAFWVTGDGNFIEYPDTSNTDLHTLAPPDYNFPPNSDGPYVTTAYLTGKYTNTTPPPQYSRTINLGARPSQATPFKTRMTAGQSMDIHHNHDLRRGHLTTFVVSYPNTVNGKLFLFYNGRKDPSTHQVKSCPKEVLTYETSDIPKYFLDNKVTGAASRPTSILPTTIIDGLAFQTHFKDLTPRLYRDFVVYPLENVDPTSMPTGFTEKRQFPVLRGNPDTIAARLEQADSLLSFFAILIGNQPLNPQENPVAFQQVNNVLNALGLDLSPSSAIAVDTSTGTSFYVTAAQEITVEYLASFDPNQLVVEDIKPENGFYRVNFRLEICNAGAGDVLNEKISIHYPPGAFWDFQYPLTQGKDGNGYNYNLVSHEDGEWKFDIRMFLPGIPQPLPGQPHQEVCESVYFSAQTDCNGVRSLWKENGGRVVESCVVFMESFGQTPHCHYNNPIASDQFKDGDNCLCCDPSFKDCPKNTVCDWRYCLLVLLVLLLLLLWMLKQKYLPWVSKWLT